MIRPKTHNHSLNKDFAQEWLAVFVVNKTIGEIMNYSLVGKARCAAKNTMQSKTARSANVAVYANREASRDQKVLAFAGEGKNGEMLLKWVKGDFLCRKPLRVI